MNHDLDTIYQWAHQWKKEFNPHSTKQATEVLFSCKKVSPNHPQLIFNGTTVVKVNEQKYLVLIPQPVLSIEKVNEQKYLVLIPQPVLSIEKVNEQKYLVLILQPVLSIEKHLYEKIIKAKKNIGTLKHISNLLPLKTLDQMYKALVSSHLDYCDAVYHIPSRIHQPPLCMTLNSLMEKVERIKYQAALAITGAWQGLSRSKIYDELGWETLSDRRKCMRVIQIHKIINNNTLSYPKDKLPPYYREMSSGNIRNTFHALLCKSNRYRNSFFPYAIASWNLFMEIFSYKDVPSIGVLNNEIISLIRPESFFSLKIHDPAGLN